MGQPDVTAPQRFAVAAARHPDRLAVRADDGSLTFDQLRRRVADLAAALRGAGVGPGDVVGVRLGRSFRLPVALLAAWQAGAAYLPLDPSYPDARLASMCADARVAAIVSDEDLGWASETPVIGPDATGAPGDEVVGELAYVIYTSGSSGTPKGVEVTHGNLAGLIDGLERAGAYPDEPAVVGWNASASFDASVQQWVRVVRGDTVVLLGERTRLDGAGLANLLREAAVTDLDLTPSHWPHLRTAVLQVAVHRPLRLFIGGEPIPPAVWREIAAARERGLSAYNLYGPTEVTVDSTIAEITGTEPHIGVPLPGVRLSLVDELGNPVADGNPGEICLGGRQVARGYRNNPSLTAERFVTGAGSGERHYRTGDLARWSGSVLHFLGRIDRQLKVGGYRVEPGEVEKALVARAGVAHAAVTVQTDADGTALLVAHVVPVAGADVAEQDLRQHCATLLPAYLRPSLYRLTDTLPLTVSGKIDFAALPSVEPTPDRGPGDAEQTVAIVWRDLLGRPVGPDDNFFALGGHSLLAIRAVSRVREQLGVVLSINDIYEHPSLADFTAVAVRAGEGRR